MGGSAFLTAKVNEASEMLMKGKGMTDVPRPFHRLFRVRSSRRLHGRAGSALPAQNQTTGGPIDGVARLGSQFAARQPASKQSNKKSKARQSQSAAHRGRHRPFAVPRQR